MKLFAKMLFSMSFRAGKKYMYVTLLRVRMWKEEQVMNKRHWNWHHFCNPVLLPWVWRHSLLAVPKSSLGSRQLKKKKYATDSQRLMSRWKYQFSCDHWSQASGAQPVFRWMKLSEQWWVLLLLCNLGVKPTWLLWEMGNSALEADPRIPPNQCYGFNSCYIKRQLL